MKAFVVEKYGQDGLRAAEVPEPEVGDGDVLVKVSAASINPLDKMVRNGDFKRLLKYLPRAAAPCPSGSTGRGRPRGRRFVTTCLPVRDRSGIGSHPLTPGSPRDSSDVRSP
jgi:hypothetical protein